MEETKYKSFSIRSGGLFVDFCFSAETETNGQVIFPPPNTRDVPIIQKWADDFMGKHKLPGRVVFTKRGKRIKWRYYPNPHD